MTTPTTPSFERALAGSMRDTERVTVLGLPGRKHEEWRFVRLQHLDKPEHYLTAQDVSPSGETIDAIKAMLTEHVVEEAKGRLVVCVNGVYQESLSDLSALGDDATISVVAPDGAPKALGSVTALVQDGQDYFTALSDESWQQAIVLDIKADVKVGCVHLVQFYHAQGDAPVVSTPRVFVHVGSGSKGSLVEEHLSVGQGSGTLGVAAVEVSLEPNARFDHIKVQTLSLQDNHIARAAVKVVEGAHYASVTFHLGAQLSRQDLHAEIAGGNTNCELHGLALIDGDQVSDTHSSMNHVHPHAHSDQVHKCVVGGKAHAVFNGKIFVREGAQQIDAFQLNRNLLLSNRARVDTKPQLEILADDVKCSHGATIGQLDEDQVFYLQARGIPADEARGLLTYAFAGELVERVPQLSLRKRLSGVILDKTQR